MDVFINIAKRVFPKVATIFAQLPQLRFVESTVYIDVNLVHQNLGDFLALYLSFATPLAIVHAHFDCRASCCVPF